MAAIADKKKIERKDVQNGDPWTPDEGVAKQEDEKILLHGLLSGVDVPEGIPAQEVVAICWPDFVRVDVTGPCEDGWQSVTDNENKFSSSKKLLCDSQLGATELRWWDPEAPGILPTEPPSADWEKIAAEIRPGPVLSPEPGYLRRDTGTSGSTQALPNPP
ncbi:hypothetical protein J6590_072415 [Homalodisca vitripennis]|nr:hypothetical protein J6590_072415 [Homalodisca vitripennis]